MAPDKHLDKLRQAGDDSAKRQDEMLDRMEQLATRDPQAAKELLRNLTNTSKWELYARIYARFALISLLIVAVIFALAKFGGFLNDEPPPPVKASAGSLLRDLHKAGLSAKLAQSSNGYAIELTADDTTSSVPVQNFAGTALAISRVAANADLEWEVSKGELSLGKVQLEQKQDRFKRNGQSIRLKQAVGFDNNCGLLFRIEDASANLIKNAAGLQDTITEYQLRFAEAHAADTVWTGQQFSYLKTDNGRIIASLNPPRLLTNDAWEKGYVVCLGIGKLGAGDIVYYAQGEVFAIALR